jgi:hypothetical protein
MAETLMLINPKRRSGARKKTRTAAQKAATRKLVAMNRRRRNPAARSTSAAPARRRRRNPVAAMRRTTRRYRRNPIGGKIMPLLMDSAQMAVGGVAFDLGYGYLAPMLPPVMQTGMVKHATKGGIAILAGMLLKPMLGKMAGKMVEGALTVTMYNAIKEMTAGAGMPVGYYSAGQIARGQMPPQLSEYVNASPDSSAFGYDPAGSMGEYVFA